MWMIVLISTGGYNTKDNYRLTKAGAVQVIKHKLHENETEMRSCEIPLPTPPPLHGLRLTVISFLPIICKGMLNWFHFCLGFLLALLHLHWGLHLLHLRLGRINRYAHVKHGGKHNLCQLCPPTAQNSFGFP